MAVLRGHDAGIVTVAFASNGRRLASTSKDGTVRIWDVTTFQK
jgi:WD40 repeat protein